MMKFVVKLHEFFRGRVFKVEVLHVEICFDCKEKIVWEAAGSGFFTDKPYNGTFECAAEKTGFLNKL